MLTFVPTPIGNLKDITIRSLEAFLKAKVVVCEDTRIAKRLFLLLEEKFSILLQSDFFQFTRDSSYSLNPKNKLFISFHSHNQEKFLATLSSDFFEQEVIYISDAGMPSICDPGALLVQYARTHNISYEVLPGCCALNVAFCFSGIDSQEFIFGGFLPHKSNERKNKILKLIESHCPIIVYESPHRILEALKDICEVAKQAQIFAIKEISKMHQSYFFGTPSEVLTALQNTNIHGEWVLVLSANAESRISLSYCDILSLPLPLKDKSKLLSLVSHKDSKQIYKELLEQK